MFPSSIRRAGNRRQVVVPAALLRIPSPSARRLPRLFPNARRQRIERGPSLICLKPIS
jgi:hypothetical protein